jgi:hypothetical protein
VLKTISVIVISVFALCGCVSVPPKLTLDHEVRVPKEWSGGANCPGFSDDGNIERYVSAYDRGWWWCVVEHAKDIDFQPKCSDYFISGWAAETYGWPAGVSDADTRIEKLVSTYGKQKVSAMLSEYKDVKLDDGIPK